KQSESVVKSYENEKDSWIKRDKTQSYWYKIILMGYILLLIVICTLLWRLME
ncbi:class A sortase, partial [Bacillus cereus]